MSFYIYILHSLIANKYYVGYSNDPFRRLIEHNSTPFNSYTSKFRPWELKACFYCGTDEKRAITLERFIKKQKSRTLLEKLINPDFIPDGFLAQLVRVPHRAGQVPSVRD